MKKLLITVFLFFLLVAGSGVSLAGCDVGVDQNTLNTIDNAITAINNAPSSWHLVLDETINHLADKTTEVAKQVQTLLNNSVAFIGVEARCDVDFLGIRIRDTLIYIRDKLLGRTPESPTPWVCHFSPETLELNWNASQGRWAASIPIVIVYGFNFSYAGLPKVELHDANNKMVRLANVTPTYSSTYEIQLNFQTEDFNTVGTGFSYYLNWSATVDPKGFSILKLDPSDPPCNISTVTQSGSSISCTKFPNGFVYEIDKPNVTQRETEYPMVSFLSGETVNIAADGCVQTGGSGATWKLYVSPQGDNSDHLYHGLISIPGGITQGLVRIQNVIGTSFVVGNLAPGVSTLSLGYEDDDYSDNGYSNHDNGTGDQCFGVGNARVKITIQLPSPSKPIEGPPGVSITGITSFNVYDTDLAVDPTVTASYGITPTNMSTLTQTVWTASRSQLENPGRLVLIAVIVFDMSGSRTARDSSTFTVQVTVYDAGGRSATASITVKVTVITGPRCNPHKQPNNCD